MDAQRDASPASNFVVSFGSVHLIQPLSDYLFGAKKMTLSYKRVLNPIDFDEHSIKATPVAAELARYSAGKMFLLHVVPMTRTSRIIHHCRFAPISRCGGAYEA